MKRGQAFSIQFKYDVHFTNGLFLPSNALLASVLADLSDYGPARVVFILDGGLVSYYPNLADQIREYITCEERSSLLAPPLIVLDGEEAKNSVEELFRVLQFINDANVDRHAFVVAVGGGAVLDMVGFAAAVSHRGIRHIRVPTTILSQNDSGVGVKNGINFFGKKNFLGTFAPPAAVINDFDFLRTLDNRDWKSGCAEAVKVALIKDSDFFSWIEKHATAIRDRDMKLMEELIIRCADLHMHHISHSDDPFEMGSSRPLDFGHWAAHKLEQLSSFDIRHGEAVSIGISLDVMYATFAGYLSEELSDRVLQTLAALGLDLFHPLLLADQGKSINPLLIRGLEEFREHLGGRLTIPMISELGVKFDVHELNNDWIEAAALKLSEKQELHAC